MNVSRVLLAACLLVGAGLLGSIEAQAQSRNLHSGGSVDLGSVYWIDNDSCKSRLKSVESVEVIEGPPGVTLRLRNEPVLPIQHQCKAAVPGAMVVLTAGQVAKTGSYRIKYRVHYIMFDTGRTTSDHTARVNLIAG